MRELTERQKLIYDFIKDYMIMKGYAPSIRDISRHFKMTPRGAQLHLIALEKKGYIKRGKGPRTISLLDRKESIVVPVKGKIAAGQAIEMFEQIDEEIEVPLAMLKGYGEYFALKVQGDSMINAHILDGDYVVIKRQYSAENNSIVAAVVEDKITLKRLVLKDDHIELIPENDAYQPIVCEPKKVRIIGKMVGLIRIFR
ncbi:MULTISPECIES: transcriptional repressor LexA [Fervidobacterium]|uniref:LexA repressor n=1 Tax=Fervidobacterium nodosum (strain ATCC 35602 / DSM 5306 / Rt17-B1) TaxID=381764 RepID=A7HL63_FERNB|nr:MULTISPECIES: transcriptional repressor LexA [Fervidobacterium]ABS60646.1 SOS-response transcriptional repressor, LexA [Fervidobacterium nodosum Rt17-B1]KAF2961575.1 LexA family transcriptional regulator [Fervidobacterium sp. 2310opik-2]